MALDYIVKHQSDGGYWGSYPPFCTCIINIDLIPNELNSKDEINSDINSLIDSLSSDNIDLRESATKKLIRYNKLALSALHKRRGSTEPESRSRINYAIQAILKINTHESIDATAYAICFMAKCGINVNGDNKKGRAMKNAIDWLISKQSEGGQITNADFKTNCIVFYALCETLNLATYDSCKNAALLLFNYLISIRRNILVEDVFYLHAVKLAVASRLIDGAAATKYMRCPSRTLEDEKYENEWFLYKCIITESKGDEIAQHIRTRLLQLKDISMYTYFDQLLFNDKIWDKAGDLETRRQIISTIKRVQNIDESCNKGSWSKMDMPETIKFTAITAMTLLSVTSSE
jgi:hypothetical protein